MEIIKITLTEEQHDALAPLRLRALADANDRAAETTPDGVTPPLQPIGIIVAQMFIGEDAAQMHCVYVPPDMAVQMAQYVRKALNIV